MHPLINEQMVEPIRSTGDALEDQPNRMEMITRWAFLTTVRRRISLSWVARISGSCLW